MVVVCCLDKVMLHIIWVKKCDVVMPVFSVGAILAVARTCSLIFIVLDVLKPLGHKRLIEHELEGFGIR